MKTLKFATSNKNKLIEASKILWINIEQIDIELDEIQTIDIEELIRHKAMEAYKNTWEIVIVEDSWLWFISWNWLPWALIKRFMTSVWNEWILKMIQSFESRVAIAMCYVAMYDGKKFYISKWEIRWTISEEIRWTSWFWWDVIFIPDWYDKTYSEMSIEEKNNISHRKIAFENFKQFIK